MSQSRSSQSYHHDEYEDEEEFKSKQREDQTQNRPVLPKLMTSIIEFEVKLSLIR